MKELISNYTFNTTTKAVAFLDYTTIALEGVLLITNVRTNQIIYNFADPCLGGSTIGNTLILTTATTGMLDTDKLQIFYDNGKESASELTLQSLEDMLSYLKMMVQNTKVLNTQDTLQRQRTVVENTVNVTGTVNALPTYGDLTNRQEMSRLEFAQGIRNNLVF